MWTHELVLLEVHQQHSNGILKWCVVTNVWKACNLPPFFVESEKTKWLLNEICGLFSFQLNVDNQ